MYNAGSSEPKTTAESIYIISYLGHNYHPNRRLAIVTEDNYKLVDYYCLVTDGSLQPYLVSLLVGHHARTGASRPASYVMSHIISRVNNEYDYSILRMTLPYRRLSQRRIIVASLWATA